MAVARRAASLAARDAGFAEAEQGRVALVATELAANLHRHAGGGELLLHAAEGQLSLLALDRGPGMADLAACLRDGFSTAGTPGTGLGAVRRGADLFDIHTAPGLGTAVLARFRAGRGEAPLASPCCDAVCLPKPEEVACGDDWACGFGPGGAALLVADGLGHGPQAADASRQAVRLFRRAPLDPPATILARLHEGLRATRGAAISIGAVEADGRSVSFAGLGNVMGCLVSAAGSRRLVSLDGIAGHGARRLRDFQYPVTAPGLLLLCSDGIATSWSLDRYAGVLARDPLLVAGLVYRDFRRGRDDATVAVLRVAPR